VTKAHRSGSKTSERRRDDAIVRDQLVRAFPFPKSGKFEDLLTAIDEQVKLRKT